MRVGESGVVEAAVVAAGRPASRLGVAVAITARFSFFDDSFARSADQESTRVSVVLVELGRKRIKRLGEGKDQGR